MCEPCLFSGIAKGPKHDDTYGAIKEAYLVLCGALLAAIDPSPQIRKFEDDFHHSGPKAALTKDGTTVGILYPDIKDEILSIKRLFCLSVRGVLYESQIRRSSDLYPREEDMDQLNMGLLLEEKFGGDYRRIGLARWVKKSIFDGSKPCLVRLV